MKFLFSFARLKGKYNDLAEMEKGTKSTSLGILGIVNAIFAAAFLTVVYFAFGMSKDGGAAAIVGIVMLIVCAAAAFLLFLYGIYATILQLRLNRKAVGFISLMLQILLVAGAIAMVVVIGIV